jgi:hypothetical protein
MPSEISAQDLAALGLATDSGVLLNVIERLVSELHAVREELGRLRDENNRLKGEQGRPGGSTKKQPKLDRSSERERREQPKQWRKRAKLPEIVIDRQVACRLDPADLPADARLKDHIAKTWCCGRTTCGSAVSAGQRRVRGRPTRRRCRQGTRGSSVPA